MAKNDLREKVLKLRAKGLSYSQIRTQVQVSKSTLSIWLAAQPLSKEQVDALRGKNPIRIERYRQTMLKKRQSRHDTVYKQSVQKIGKLSKREMYIAGLFLYWAEGTKAARDLTMFTNTDPAMILFCIQWLGLLGVAKKDLRVYMHLYDDMDIEAEISFWTTTLGIERSAFRKPYIKASTRTGTHSYKGRFNHGTCNLYIGSRDVYEEVMMGLKHIRRIFGGIDFPMLQAL